MSNPAFIIDGYTEKKIVQVLCPGQPIRRTDLNGKNVSIEAIAKKMASFIRLLGNKYYPIIIVIDKEERQISYAEMSNRIRNALIAEGVTDQDLRIGVADRMIENWVLADWKTLAEGRTKPKSTEGSNGASIIRKVKGSYSKTTDGVEFFLKADPNQLYKNSTSFRYFIDQLGGISCEYLKFKK